jgi:hypothetical protein
VLSVVLDGLERQATEDRISMRDRMFARYITERVFFFAL